MYTLFNNATTCNCSGTIIDLDEQKTQMMLLGSAATLIGLGIITAIYVWCVWACAQIDHESRLRYYALLQPLNEDMQLEGVPNVHSV
jgi:hypothetical protein